MSVGELAPRGDVDDGAELRYPAGDDHVDGIYDELQLGKAPTMPEIAVAAAALFDDPLEPRPLDALALLLNRYVDPYEIEADCNIMLANLMAPGIETSYRVELILLYRRDFESIRVA